jgi:hypothetical protein
MPIFYLSIMVFLIVFAVTRVDNWGQLNWRSILWLLLTIGLIVATIFMLLGHETT